MIGEVLDGELVRLRPVLPDDEQMLAALFTEPDVERWWGDAADSVQESLHPGESESGMVIELNGEPIGFIQATEENYPMYRHAALDIAIRAGWQGKGYGPDAIKTLIRYLITKRGHHRLTIDPAAHNTRAIKAYRKIGFKPVGVMRSYEKGPSGEWHDGLLMDLLAEDIEL